MNRSRIPVVWGVDEKYVLPAFVVIHSILANSRARYHFFILTTDEIMRQVQEYVDILEKQYNNFDVVVKNVEKEIFSNAKINNKHLSTAAYFRLLIPELIIEYDKCIYLDCDILVNGDLLEFYAIDIKDNYLAGVKDCHIIEDSPREEQHEKILGIPSRDRYINSGVLLMNLKKMRVDSMVQAFLLQMNKENWYEDQDVLNCCCYPHIMTIPLKYNLFHFYYGKSIRFLYHLDYEKQDFEFSEPFIVHMGARWKPWNSRRVKCADKWWSFAEVFHRTEYFKKYRKQSMKKDEIDILFEEIEKNKDKQFAICGYSQNGRNLCDMLLSKGYNNIVAFTDNDKEKWGKEYHNIPVTGITGTLTKRGLFWIISNQVAFEEVRTQLLSSGVKEEDIVRYINLFDDKLYLLSLDEKFYDYQIARIAQFEYGGQDCHMLEVLKSTESFCKEYEYLEQKYHFEYWYNLEKAGEDTNENKCHNCLLQ